MNWIVASSLMFAFSVGQYLIVRKTTLEKIPTKYNNLAMFGIPVLLFIPLAAVSHTSFAVTPYQFLIILISAVLFSYLGNVFSLKSIELAPNPGYPLVLSKSYVVFTAIASVLFLGQTFTGTAAMAIAAIVVGAALLTITSKKSKVTDDLRWLPYAVGSFFCWGMLALATKYTLTLGVPVLTRLIIGMGIVAIIILADVIKNRHHMTLNRNILILLLLNGIGSAGFNFFMLEAFQTAPNVGYVNAINASSIAAVAICSAFIFKDELTKRKLLGILVVTAGLIVLVTG